METETEQTGETSLDPTTLTDEALVTQITEADKPLENKDTEKTDPSVEVKKEEPPPSSPITGEVKVSADEWDKIQKRLTAQESFIGRQSNEIGVLRKTAQERVERLNQELKDNSVDMLTDPVGMSKKVDEIKKAEEEVDNLGMQEITMHNRQTVQHHIPDFEKTMDGIVEILKNDGIPTDAIEQFKANPYGEKPAVLINLARRVVANEQNKTLRFEIETLKKEKDSAEQTVVKKIEEAMKGKDKTLTASSGQASQGKPLISEDQITYLSDNDLSAALAAASNE